MVGVLVFLGLSTLAGNTINIAGNSKTAYEEGSYTKLVELNGAIAPAGAGVDITFRLAATEYDANGACYLNTNEIIVIPAEYMTEGGVASTIPHGYQVTGNDGGVGAARLYTADHLLSTQVLAVAVPNGTELMVRGGNYAQESASGSGKSSGWYHRHFIIQSRNLIGLTVEVLSLPRDGLNILKVDFRVSYPN